MGGSLKPTLCIAKVIHFLIKDKIYRTKNALMKILIRAFPLKLNIIMKRFISLYF
jgi:hypothetical protein